MILMGWSRIFLLHHWLTNVHTPERQSALNGQHTMSLMAKILCAIKILYTYSHLTVVSTYARSKTSNAYLVQLQ
jgi:hypothetical protein